MKTHPLSTSHLNDRSGIPESVDYHFLRACNMRCRYCFATFTDVRRFLSHQDQRRLVRILARVFQKITLVGGEPMLSSILPELASIAKSCEVITSLVTNGSLVTPDRIKELPFDWVTLSIDSANSVTNKGLGRAINGTSCDSEHYVQLSRAVRESGKHLKVNTVVTKLNFREDMSDHILRLNPERWKIFQVLPIKGENDQWIDGLRISKDEFIQFVEKHRSRLDGLGMQLVPEDNRLMTGSYAMVDPLGRFFDNINGRHQYSRSILEVGLQQAWEDILFYADRFVERGGADYFRDRAC